MKNEKQFATPNQVASRLGCSRETVMRLIRTGELEAINFGQASLPRYRITAAAVEDMLKRRTVKPTEQPQRQGIVQKTSKKWF